MHYSTKVASGLFLGCLALSGTTFAKDTSKEVTPTQSTQTRSSTGSGIYGLHDLFWASTTKGAVPVNELYKQAFYQLANINSYYSTAYNGYCFGNNFCVSGIANVDASYFTRQGVLSVPGSAPQFGLNNTMSGSLAGFGNRPVFGPSSTEYFGSFNNANVFFDARVNDWVTMHVDIAYVNGSVKTRFANHENADWGDVYRNGAAVKGNEVYLMFAQPEVTPWYVKIGKTYLNFGDYKPFPMTESLTQLLSQIRTGAAIVGFVLPNGMYASANWSMAQQSIDNINNTTLFGGPGSKSKNFGGQVGVQNVFSGVLLNLNASYIRDIRDSDYLSGAAYLFNTGLRDLPFFNAFLANQVIVMQRVPAVAFHGDAEIGRFGVMGEYVTATRSLNPNPAIPDGKIYAWTVSGNVKFNVLQFASRFDVSYQRGGNSNVFRTILTGPLAFNGGAQPLVVGNVLPKDRYQFTFESEVMPNIMLALQWLRDKDRPSYTQGGTRRSSDKGVLRVSAQV